MKKARLECSSSPTVARLPTESLNLLAPAGAVGRLAQPPRPISRVLPPAAEVRRPTRPKKANVLQGNTLGNPLVS